MSRTKKLLLVNGILLVIVGVAFGYFLNYTSEPGFCASCHSIEPYEASWEGSTHEAVGVTCIDCHFDTGALGYIEGKVYSFMKLTQWVVGEEEQKPEAHKTVVAGSCRQCHSDPKATFIPHGFHTEVANLDCIECHSGIVHGSELVGEEKPQAAADPSFCNNCHTGDFAPILFAEVEPAGREHPGAPKIDVNVWRNIHWRMADGPAVIDGQPYDEIEKDTCLACHDEPTRAKACKVCHSARVPGFRVSTAAQRASGVPLGIFAVMFILLMLAWILKTDDKEKLFSSRWIQGLVTLVVLSDVYVVYLIVRDTLVRESGSVEIGPTTVWITYLLVSIAMVLLVIYEAVIKPGALRLVLLPETDEDEIYVPDPRKRTIGPKLEKEEPSEKTGAGPSPPGQSPEGGEGR